MTADDLTTFRAALLGWYGAAARDLPWRGAGRTPWRVLVSEAMLQQTQVKTVLPFFARFVERFPTVESLAAADEEDVLRLWQGLGYYSRARNLQKAARAIVEQHGGEVPRTVEQLLNLPGVGRYTAGAVASIAFDVPAPILDGNVIRVLCRLDKIEADPRVTATQKRLWDRAAEVVDPRRPGDFNSAMMELGATVCAPRSPQCLICPVAAFCQARAAGVQDRIPPPKRAVETPLVERDVYRIADADGRLLVERRPPTGRWAGLWQFVTRPPGGPLPVTTAAPRPAGEVRLGLSHRRYVFRVFDCETSDAAPPPLRFAGAAELADLPMSRPQRRIAQAALVFRLAR